MDLLLYRDLNKPEGYDMAFINGECPTTGDTVDIVTQRLYIRLKTLYAEWFLNVEYGVPYFERILGIKNKNNKATADMIIQEHIMMDAGVKQITFFESQFDNTSRVYSCQFRALVEDGNETATITI